MLKWLGKEDKKMVRYKTRGHPQKRPSKAVFDMQYYDMNLTPQEMANAYNVKVSTIYNWATYYRKIDKESETE